MENLYQGEKSKLLDPRGVFIVQGPSNVPVYIWQGANVPEENVAPYMRQALSYHKLLVKHERANEQY